MESALDLAPCGFLSFTDDGIVTRVNSTLCEILGVARDQLAGAHVEEMLTISGRIFYQTHLFPLLRLHGRADEIFLLLRRGDGGETGVLVNAVRRTRDGTALTDAVLMVVRERRKYEDELLRAKRAAEEARRILEEQAEELEAQAVKLETQALELGAQREAAEDANRAKTQFLTVMSHELRTPLNAIAGYVGLLELGVRGPMTPLQHDDLARISRAQRHLLRLINDVLNLVRIEAGKVDYQLDDVAVSALVARVLPLVEPQLQAKAITVSVDLPTGLRAHCDSDKAQQVLVNLLSNAHKFTDEGGHVTVAACIDAAAPDTVRITVSDTGRGIPADNLVRIFEPFVQVAVEAADRREGTGLGLAISRDLARGMGGDLTVESMPGVGSRFTVTLPAAT